MGVKHNRPQLEGSRVVNASVRSLWPALLCVDLPSSQTWHNSPAMPISADHLPTGQLAQPTARKPENLPAEQDLQASKLEDPESGLNVPLPHSLHCASP